MVVEKPKALSVYFDTTFIIDLSIGKKLPCSILEEAKKNNWKHYCSVFGIMECLDIMQENFFFTKNIKLGKSIKRILHKRRERDLSDKELEDLQQKLVNTFLKPQNINYGFMFDVQGWSNCIKVVRESNINSSDAIHLVTAIALNCDILLTSDGPFIEEGNKYLEKISKNQLRLCRPEQYSQILKERGFTF